MLVGLMRKGSVLTKRRVVRGMKLLVDSCESGAQSSLAFEVEHTSQSDFTNSNICVQGQYQFYHIFDIIDGLL